MNRIPDCVINQLHLSGERDRIEKLLAMIRGDDSVIDFNKIIPMPEPLRMELGNPTNNGLKAYLDFISVYIFDGMKNKPDLLNIPEKSEQAFLRMRSDIKRDEWELGKAAFQNQLRYGTPNWCEWMIVNWGTKSAAYGTGLVGYKIIIFHTAWSRAMPVITKLAQMYPDISFEYRWADEDIGANVGIAEFKGGEVVHDEYYNDFSREAYEFAAELWGLDLEEMGYVFDEKTQTYEYRDPDEHSDTPAMT